jgi:hypothetical protein
MEITATFATGSPITVSVDTWQADAVAESFFEIGAITVSVK